MRYRCVLGQACIAAGLILGLATPALAGPKKQRLDPNRGPNQAVTADTLTDEQVLASIRKGVEYLFSIKRGDNWELGAGGHGNVGGETALVLYALLHVGEGVREDPQLGPRLTYKSEELAPVVRWLAKNDPLATYTTGLQASALALVKKQTELGDLAKASLENCKGYILEAMGPDGGYTYVQRGANKGYKVSSLAAAWSKYIDAANAKEKASARNSLIHVAHAASSGAGGVQAAVQKLADEIKDRHTTASKNRDRAALQRAETEARELLALRPELLRQQAAVAPSKAPARPATFKQFGDLSNGQYGTLGAWALMDYGIELPNSYWITSDRFWRCTQHADGGWGYSAGARATHSMTVAGIASLFITAEMVDAAVVRSEPRPDKELERGLAWLDANFKPLANAYYLYGVERVGLASGLKFFGTANWYRQGAALLVNTQAADGSWSGGFAGARSSVATAYSLLFLARGRNPVVFNKLQYDGPWNARPLDNARITRWMSKKFDNLAINWQVVNLKVSPDEWLDAPVLLITGGKALNFSAADVAKLRAFVNAGGLIFSVAEGTKPEFTESVRKIAAQMVTGEDGKVKYEMRELPKNHVLFSLDLWAQIDNPPRILALSNEVRELWIHSTVDMNASWQALKVADKANFEFPTNVYRYASGKASLLSKLQPLTLPPAMGAAARSLTLARLDYSGNDDPEPGAWPRMAKLLRLHAKTDLTIKSSKIAALDPKATPLAHMTGTTTFPVTEADVAALRKYLDGGGTLFADAAGGKAEFTKSFLTLASRLYPDKPLGSISTECPLVNGKLTDSVDLARVEYRMYYRLKLGNRHSVGLQGIQVNGRYVVIFSPEDVTSGLLGTSTWGILGYTPEWAQAIARNVVLYALNPTPAAATTAPAAPPAPTASTAPAAAAM